MARRADPIRVIGARENNLKNVSLDIPRYRFTVLTGPSGSGKSSLAFDTLFAEGQRRYVESLSSQARQVIGELSKPDVDLIEGLSPAIAVTQHSTVAGPRSTVGTLSEIGGFLRLLYARVGVIGAGEGAFHLDRAGIVERLTDLGEGSGITILSPVLEERKGAQKRLLERLRKAGLVRIRLNGEMHDLDETASLPAQHRNTVEAVVDRIVLGEKTLQRLRRSLGRALELGAGRVRVLHEGDEWTFSDAGGKNRPISALSPGLFSFNSRSGACPSCQGLGTLPRLREDLLVSEPALSLEGGAIPLLGGKRGSWLKAQVMALAQELSIPMDRPWKKLGEKQRRVILEGGEGLKIEVDTRTGSQMRNFEGLMPYLERRHRETSSSTLRRQIEKAMGRIPCPDCKGARLGPEPLRVKLGGCNFSELSAKTLTELDTFLADLKLSGPRGDVAGEILPEIRSRLEFLRRVGLGYLSLDRSATTLSGGERQRLALAEQVGAQMTGVLYILDEPSIGLHPRDQRALLETLEALRDRGNTVLVVEHDRETIERADWVVDLGPGAGERGGEVVAQGTPDEIRANDQSPTGRALLESAKPLPDMGRKGNGSALKIRGARQHNLKDLNLSIPLGVITCVTGVSGSGKSSLVHDVVYQHLARQKGSYGGEVGLADSVKGGEDLGAVIHVDQAAIGRSPRSNPATYSGAWGVIREHYAKLPESRLRGYGPGRFSFNVKGGRCEACLGDGERKVTLHFLPPAFVPCEICRGRRFNRETLEIHYRGRNIAELLEMTIEQALEHFSEVPRVTAPLESLVEVGLGYLRLGQSALKLSGGEAQRLKLARQLARRGRAKTLYILDEPSTGLHFEEVRTLMSILRRLVDRGHSVIIIEHNPDIIREADYIVDLGPDGGPGGGEVVVAGPLSVIQSCEASHTGTVLKD